MVYPIYDFTNEALNYQEVEDTVFDMLADLNYQYNCCKPKYVKETINDANAFIQCFASDKADRPDRYKLDCKAAYLLLYEVAS